jgi:hypothetical protein
MREMLEEEVNEIIELTKIQETRLYLMIFLQASACIHMFDEGRAFAKRGSWEVIQVL